MSTKGDKCPACLRPFEKILDYPFVLVRKVTVHPVAEVIDCFSEEAARVASAQTPAGQYSKRRLGLQGINRTPEIAAAYESEPVQNYLGTLQGLAGKIVSPHELLPRLEADRYFKWAYPLPGTKLYLALSEAAPESGRRVSQVMWCCKGPNLGSAGGPTLQHLAALASINYEGRYPARP